MMDFLYDLLLYLGLIILGIILAIAVASALPYAILFTFLDRDSSAPSKDSTIKRIVRDSNGDEYEKSYSSSNHCEHVFDDRTHVSKCEFLQFTLATSLVGLIIGGIMSYFGEFAYKTIGISFCILMASWYFHYQHEKKNGNDIL